MHLATTALKRRTLLISTAVALGATLAVVACRAMTAKAQTTQGARPTIVLVHGDWADASSWTGVMQRLQGSGYKVVAPPNPLRGPGEDASYLASYLKSISGPIVLVAHSYGGFVTTNAASSTPSVKALVYVDAFIPDQGDTLASLAASGKSCISQTALNPVPYASGVDLYLRWGANSSYTGFAHCFANGVSSAQAAVLYAEQRPAAAAEFTELSGPPAWKTIPSWALIGTRDHVIPRALEDKMAERAGARLSTVTAGHLSLITNPARVANVILAAAVAASS